MTSISNINGTPSRVGQQTPSSVLHKKENVLKDKTVSSEVPKLRPQTLDSESQKLCDQLKENLLQQEDYLEQFIENEAKSLHLSKEVMASAKEVMASAKELIAPAEAITALAKAAEAAEAIIAGAKTAEQLMPSAKGDKEHIALLKEEIAAAKGAKEVIAAAKGAKEVIAAATEFIAAVEGAEKLTAAAKVQVFVAAEKLTAAVQEAEKLIAVVKELTAATKVAGQVIAPAERLISAAKELVAPAKELVAPAKELVAPAKKLVAAAEDLKLVQKFIVNLEEYVVDVFLPRSYGEMVWEKWFGLKYIVSQSGKLKTSGQDRFKNEILESIAKINARFYEALGCPSWLDSPESNESQHREKIERDVEILGNMTYCSWIRGEKTGEPIDVMQRRQAALQAVQDLLYHLKSEKMDENRTYSYWDKALDLVEKVIQKKEDLGLIKSASDSKCKCREPGALERIEKFVGLVRNEKKPFEDAINLVYPEKVAAEESTFEWLGRCVSEFFGF